MEGIFFCDVHRRPVHIRKIEQNEHYAKAKMSCGHYFHIEIDELFDGKIISYLTPQKLTENVHRFIQHVLSIDPIVLYYKLVKILKKAFYLTEQEVNKILFNGAKIQDWYIDRSLALARIVQKTRFEQTPHQFSL